MAVVAVLQELWRRRLLLLAGVLIALGVQFLMMYRVTGVLPPELESRQYRAGVSATEVLVDSPRSQVVDLGGTATDIDGAAVDLGGLASRARLLASLMATSPLKDRIAARGGIAPDRLFVLAPAGTISPTAPAPDAADIVGDRGSTTLSLHVDEMLPIITMRVQAPDSAAAGRLASAAVTELRQHLQSVASSARVPYARQLVVSPLGPAKSGIVVRGPRRLYSALAFVLIVGLWCAAMLLVPRARQMWREAARASAAGEPRTAYAVEIPTPGVEATSVGPPADGETRVVLRRVGT